MNEMNEINEMKWNEWNEWNKWNEIGFHIILMLSAHDWLKIPQHSFKHNFRSVEKHVYPT